MIILYGCIRSSRASIFLLTSVGFVVNKLIGDLGFWLSEIGPDRFIAT